VSVPAADSGPIQNFIRSLYSAAFYAAAPWLGLRVGIRNLLLLAAILGTITATQWSAVAGSGLADWQSMVASGEMPSLTLTNGRLQVDGPQPWVFRDSGGGLFVIDTTGAWTGIPDSVAAGLFIGPDRAVYKSAPEMSRTYAFEGQTLPYPLDAAGVGKTRKVIVPLVLVFMTPLALLYYVVVNGALAVLISAMAMALLRIFRPLPQLGFRNVLTVALFILTPVALLFRFLGLVTPDVAQAARPFYPALAASLLLAALSSSARPAGAGGTEPPERES